MAVKIVTLSEAYASAFDTYSEMLTNAQDAVSEAFGNQIDTLTEYADKFGQFSESIGGFMTEMLSGNLSTLDPSAKYSLAAQEFDSVLAKARAGDEDALSKFADVSQTFLEASREVNASSSAYTSDFNKVYIAAQDLYNSTAASAAGAKTQAELLQSQLDTLNAQVDAITGVNNSVLGVEDAVKALTALMAGGFTSTANGITTSLLPTLSSSGSTGNMTIQPVVNGSHADGLGYVPFDGYIAELHKGEAVLTAAENAALRSDFSGYGASNTTALVEEIKALRAEVKNLRDGQREQTGQLIAATYDSNERNAQAVVEGQREAASIGAYAERAKATLV